MPELKTLTEWFQDGVTKLRWPRWNEWAYVEISGANGYLHPWAKLYDVGCPGKDLLVAEMATNLFEPWIPPADYEARKDEIYNENIFKDVFLKGE